MPLRTIYPFLDVSFSDLPVGLAGNLDYSFPDSSYKPDVQGFPICTFQGYGNVNIVTFGYSVIT